MTALLSLPLLAVLGGAADLSIQYWAVTRVQKAADAAALAGSMALAQEDPASAERVAHAIATINLPAALSAVAFTTRIDREAGLVEVAAAGRIGTNFLSVLSIDDLPVAAKASAAIEQKQFIDVYLMLDVSESMNIAASEADRLRLEAITAGYGIAPCAFACHSGNDERNLSVFEMNRQPKDGGSPARLRIDVAQDAVKRVIGALLGKNADPDSLKSIRVATSFLGDGFSRNLYPPSDESATALTSLSLDAPNPIKNGHTNYASGFAGFTDMIGRQGHGTSERDPFKVALVITDGVRDDDAAFRSFGLGPLPATRCDAIKRSEITLAILEIKYIARRGETFFDRRVRPFYTQISQALRDCASPGFHFMATDADQAKTKLIEATDALLSQKRRLLR